MRVSGHVMLPSRCNWTVSKPRSRSTSALNVDRLRAFVRDMDGWMREGDVVRRKTLLRNVYCSKLLAVAVDHRTCPRGDRMPRLSKSRRMALRPSPPARRRKYSWITGAVSGSGSFVLFVIG
jgi:hypothetical protein